MNNRFLAILIGVSLSLNFVQFFWLVEHAHSGEGVPLTPQNPITGLDGDVTVHTTKTAGGEELVQILDKTRQVVCYGKLSLAGGSSVSCQKSTK